MSIDAQLFLLTSGLAAGMCVVAWQAFRLKLIYRSRSSLVGAIAFILLAGRQVYGLARLRSTIAEARVRGVMIEKLSMEMWAISVIWPYVIVTLFIWWLHWQHKDLQKLGI